MRKCERPPPPTCAEVTSDANLSLETMSPVLRPFELLCFIPVEPNWDAPCESRSVRVEWSKNGAAAANVYLVHFFLFFFGQGGFSFLNLDVSAALAVGSFLSHEGRDGLSSEYRPVAPVVQMVTSEPPDVGDMSSNFGAVTRIGIFPHKKIKIMKIKNAQQVEND